MKKQSKTNINERVFGVLAEFMAISMFVIFGIIMIAMVEQMILSLIKFRIVTLAVDAVIGIGCFIVEWAIVQDFNFVVSVIKNYCITYSKTMSEIEAEENTSDKA